MRQLFCFKAYSSSGLLSSYYSYPLQSCFLALLPAHLPKRILLLKPRQDTKTTEKIFLQKLGRKRVEIQRKALFPSAW